ncbi:MAG: hypothetical protein QM820_33910 [Minicystis sp.]
MILKALSLAPSFSRTALGLVALSLSLAAAACGGSSDTGGMGGSGGSGGSTGSAMTAGSDLDGTWETACYQKTRTSLAYDHLAFTGTFTEYGDDACSAASAYHVSKWTGTVTVTGATAAGDTKIDLAFATFTSVALTEENAAFNNTNAYCGLTDWAANVEKDILGKDCYGFSIPVGGKSLDIYRVDGATLKFGQGSKIGTDVVEADRPTAIDEARVFTKK